MEGQRGMFEDEDGNERTPWSNQGRSVTLGAITPPDPAQLARVTDPDTSKAAAVKLGGKAGTMRLKLLREFNTARSYAASQGLTSEEAGEFAGYTAEDGAWKRVSDLLNAGLIEDSGEQRRGSSGRMQRVLRITEVGLLALDRSAAAERMGS